MRKNVYLVFHMEANQTHSYSMIVVIDAKVTSTELNYRCDVIFDKPVFTGIYFSLNIEKIKIQ